MPVSTARVFVIGFLGVTFSVLGVNAFAAPRTTYHPTPVKTAPPGKLAEGIALCNSGRYQEALGCFQKYVASNPKDAEGQFWLGTALLDMGNYVQAETVFRKAISLLPPQVAIPELHVNLGNAMLPQGKLDQALEQYQQAVKINPKEPRAHFNMARALIQKDNPVYSSIALGELEATEKLGFKPPTLLYLRAKANMDLGNLTEAKSSMNAFIGTLPKNANYEKERQAAQALAKSIDEEIIDRQRDVAPTPPEKRHYVLTGEKQYVIVSVDASKHLVTMASSDRKDPDSGQQDGRNDGIFQMPEDDAQKQVQQKGQVWRR